MTTDYAAWLDLVFGQPASPNPGAWSPEVGYVSPTDTIEILTRLFTNCRLDLSRFDNGQVAQGLWYMVSPGNSDCMFALYDPSVAWSARVACIDSIVRLYRSCFAARCENARSYFNEITNPMNGVCYMWWDVFPVGTSGASDDETAAIAGELIGVMERVLDIPHDACRESALHGLGHWQDADPQRVRAIVHRWLACTRDVSPGLRNYAFAAREGRVL